MKKWLLITHKNTFFPSSFLILGIEVDGALGMLSIQSVPLSDIFRNP